MPTSTTPSIPPQRRLPHRLPHRSSRPVAGEDHGVPVRGPAGPAGLVAVVADLASGAAFGRHHPDKRLIVTLLIAEGIDELKTVTHTWIRSSKDTTNEHDHKRLDRQYGSGHGRAVRLSYTDNNERSYDYEFRTFCNW